MHLLARSRARARGKPRHYPAPKRPPQIICYICDLSLLSRAASSGITRLEADRHAAGPLSPSWSKREDATMKNPGMKHGAELCVGGSAGLIVAGLLAAGALSGW